MANKNVVILTESNFESEVVKSDVPVLVDFFAEWCGPCRMLAPTIDAVADEYEGKAKVAKIDVDANPGITQKYGVSLMPTLIFFKNGVEVDKIVGVTGQDDIEEKLDSIV